MTAAATGGIVSTGGGGNVVAAAAALDELVRASADETEAGRRLPAPVVTALSDAGLFRMCVPASLGGGEADVATVAAAIERVAIADGSAGWCVMIGATTGLVGAYLDAETAADVYGKDPSIVSGGVVAPMGRAAGADGGFRATGRWPFASGCQHCTWLVGGCIPDSGGPPLLMVFPAADVEIIDTWTVTGLRGTGSHDMAVHDVFVPAARAFSLFTDRPREAGPLYRLPLFGVLAIGVASVSLGIARRAIDELLLLAGAKTPTGSRRRLAERATVQADVARAEAGLRSARAFLFEAMAEAWADAVAGHDVRTDRRTALRLAATHATRTAADVVTAMYEAGGGTSIYANQPLQRCFRDAHVATQHAMVGPATFELTGRLLLGLETDTAQL